MHPEKLEAQLSAAGGAGKVMGLSMSEYARQRDLDKPMADPMPQALVAMKHFRVAPA